MTYNDMPVIIPLLATGYLLTIYLLLILAQRTIKSSRYVADSVTDTYAAYVPTKQASHSDDVEQRLRIVQRSPTALWSKTESNSSASSFGATKVTPSFREALPLGKGFAKRRTGNVYAPVVANTSLTLSENATLQGAAMPNGNAEQEPLQGGAYANTQKKDGTSPSKSMVPEL